MNQDCAFCTSARTEERILKEGKLAFVIFSNPRLVPGHLLVIPKRHIEGRLQDLTREELAEIFDLLVEFQTKIITKLGSGCDIRQNYKPYFTESLTHVDHMHFHLLPRFLNDELHASEKHEYRSLPDEEKVRMWKLLA